MAHRECTGNLFTGDADFVPIVIHGECILAYTSNLEGSRQRSMQHLNLLATPRRSETIGWTTWPLPLLRHRALYCKLGMTQQNQFA